MIPSSIGPKIKDKGDFFSYDPEVNLHLMTVKGSRFKCGEKKCFLKKRHCYWTHCHRTSLEWRSQWIQETNVYMEMWISIVIFYKMKELKNTCVAEHKLTVGWYALKESAEKLFEQLDTLGLPAAVPEHLALVTEEAKLWSRWACGHISFSNTSAPSARPHSSPSTLTITTLRKWRVCSVAKLTMSVTEEGPATFN